MKGISLARSRSPMASKTARPRVRAGKAEHGDRRGIIEAFAHVCRRPLRILVIVEIGQCDLAARNAAFAVHLVGELAGEVAYRIHEPRRIAAVAVGAEMDRDFQRLQRFIRDGRGGARRGQRGHHEARQDKARDAQGRSPRQDRASASCPPLRAMHRVVHDRHRPLPLARLRRSRIRHHAGRLCDDTATRVHRLWCRARQREPSLGAPRAVFSRCSTISG